MLQSKAIDLDKFEYKWYERVFDFFFNNKVIQVSYWYERIKKNIRFYWNVLRFDYDFDFHCIFRMLNYKLIETKRVLENGIAIQDPKDMKALRICIKLAKKLDEEDYDSRVWRLTEGKYGELKINWEDIPDSDCSRMQSSYGGNDSKEYLEKVHQYKKQLYEAAWERQKRDERNLYAIMLKYRKSWWE